MFKLIVLAAVIAVAAAGVPHYHVGYGFVAHGHHKDLGHGAVAKVNAVQTGHNYQFNLHENGPHHHRYHVQGAHAPTAYGHGHGGYGGYGLGGGYGHGGFAGGYGGGYGGGFGY